MQSMVKLGDNTTLNGDSFIANYTFMRRRGFDHSKLASPAESLSPSPRQRTTADVALRVMNILTAASSTAHVALAALMLRSATVNSPNSSVRLFLAVPLMPSLAQTACDIIGAGALKQTLDCMVHSGPDFWRHYQKSDASDCDVAGGWQQPATVNIIPLDASDGSLPSSVMEMSRLSLLTQRLKDHKRTELNQPLTWVRNDLPQIMRPFAAIERVAWLDTDAWPQSPLFEAWYWQEMQPPAQFVGAFYRRSCTYSEFEDFSQPAVRAVLGRSAQDANKRRFQTDSFVVLVSPFCNARVASRVIALQRQNLVAPLWHSGHQQPPFVLAVANHTQLRPNKQATDSSNYDGPCRAPKSPYLQIVGHWCLHFVKMSSTGDAVHEVRFRTRSSQNGPVCKG